MNRDRKQRFWDGERFRFPEYYEIETNRYFDTFRDLENNTPIKNLVASDSTGLTDKNGKEIYEGDIIKRTTVFDDGGGDIHLGILTWDNRNSRYYLHSIKNELSCCFGSTSGNTSYEILGNIHETPELLKP